jgi:hypothetical protein
LLTIFTFATITSPHFLRCYFQFSEWTLRF